MLRVNLVKLYNEAAYSARDKTGVISPDDPEYFALIDEYAKWRVSKKTKRKKKGASGDASGDGETKSSYTAPPREEEFHEPDSSTSETDFDDLNLEDRIRQIPYPKRSKLHHISRQGASGALTPLGRARTYAMWKLSSADDRKRYEKCDRYFETLHDNFISKLEGVFKQTFNNIFLEPKLLDRYELCRGYQKTNFVFNLFAERIYRHSEAEVRRAEDEYNQMKQFPNQSGTDFVNALEQRRNLLRLTGTNIPNEKLKTRILSGLNETYVEYFKFYMPHKTNLEQFKADLRQADFRLNRKRKSKPENRYPQGNRPLKLKSRFQDRRGLMKPSFKPNPSLGIKPVGNIEKGYRKIKCFNCKEYGHISRDCKKPRTQNSNPRFKASKAKPVAAISREDTEEVHEDKVDLEESPEAQIDEEEEAQSEATIEM